MMRSLYSAVSGLAGNMLRMDVIGNNIANVNTVGFKAGRVNFEETLGQVQQSATAPTDLSGGTNALQVGTGALGSSVSQMYTQGSLMMTGINTDLAIEGQGLFVLTDGEMRIYTRDGSFQADALGRLVSPGSGNILQGYAYNQATETFDTGLTSIYLPLKDVEPAHSTTTIRLSGNLDADSQPEGSYMRSSVLYDSLGALATATTALVDMRQSDSGVGTLTEAGDTIHFGAVVGGETVSSNIEVAAGTTLADLVAQMETTLNSGDGVSGITVSVGDDGRLYAETPDQMGTAAEIQTLTLSASDSTGEARGTFSAALAFSDIEDARDAGQFFEEITVYDELGFSHTVKFTFSRLDGINEFTWEAAVDDGETPILQGGSGRVAFRADGSLDALVYDATGTSVPTALTIAPQTGAEGVLRMELEVGTRGSFDGLSMLRGTQSLESSQNGYSKGTFTQFTIDEAGRVMGVFSNGVLRPISQIAIAEFTNPTGLTKINANAYIESPNSGPPTIGASGEGIGSVISPGALEQANVDLAQEFTDMIVAQRGFQANARVITATDEVLTELINIKR